MRCQLITAILQKFWSISSLRDANISSLTGAEKGRFSLRATPLTISRVDAWHLLLSPVTSTRTPISKAHMMACFGRLCLVVACVRQEAGLDKTRR